MVYLRRLIFVLSIISSGILVHAQPAICTKPEKMQPFCKDACLICDINGFTGRNDAGVTGQAPAGFCTSFVHHMQWIAFMAGTPNLTLDISVFNCTVRNNPGLEIGWYQSSDCQNFTLVSNCNTDAFGNQTHRFKNTVPLIVGQYYYLVIDGNQDDVCNYKITVVDGSTKVAPLSNSGKINGDTIACKGDTKIFRADNVLGAIFYDWSIDGKFVKRSQDAKLTLDKAGDFTLCVEASNVCDKAPPVCIPLHVKESVNTSTDVTRCIGDCYTIGDSVFCNPGKHTLAYKTIYGCDSTVELNLNFIPKPSIDRYYSICEGDTLTINKKNYFAPGDYQDVLTSSNNCDSTINIHIKTLLCNIDGISGDAYLKCNGDKNGQLRFTINSGTPPFSYIVQSVSTATNIAQGIILNLGEEKLITNLPAGDYIIIVFDQLGNQRIFSNTVHQPSAITATTSLSSYGNYAVSCAGSANGTAKVKLAGGTPPYQYLWDNGTRTDSVQNLQAGNYTLTVTDANNCPLILNIVLNEPSALDLLVRPVNPTCDDESSGMIAWANTNGGVPPYAIFINGTSYAFDKLTATHLNEGYYEIQLLDSNGCSIKKFVSLVNPEHNFISATNAFEIELGDSIYIDPSTTGSFSKIKWEPAALVNCDTCINTILKPVKDTEFKLYTWSKDGCPDSLTVFIKVKVTRDVWAPNVFSPNGDQLNDKFSLFGNKQVKEIQNLQIYDRWGNMVYEKVHFPINDINFGWDGTFRGKKMNPSVFTWVGHVTFLDEVTKEYSGEFTLLR